MAESTSASSRQADQPGLVVVGAGAAGAGLARALGLAGWPLDALVCRSASRAAERRQIVGSGRPLSLDELLAETGDGDPRLLLVAVPDRSIGELATRLAGRDWAQGSVALHLSGSVEVQALNPLRERGLSVGGCHPLKSFVDPARDAATLRDTVFALEGDPAALALAERLANTLGGRPFRLAPGRRAAWHAAASHAANHLVALVDQALDLAEQAGLSRDHARAALLPLLSGTLANLADRSPAQALTGPVVRGDVDVVARHLQALEALDDDLGQAYRALATRALKLARDERALPPGAADALHHLLSPEEHP